MKIFRTPCFVCVCGGEGAANTSFQLTIFASRPPAAELTVVLGSCWRTVQSFSIVLHFAPEDETFHRSCTPDVRLRHDDVSSVSVPPPAGPPTTVMNCNWCSIHRQQHTVTLGRGTRRSPRAVTFVMFVRRSEPLKYSDTSANEDNSFRESHSLAET